MRLASKLLNKGPLSDATSRNQNFVASMELDNSKYLAPEAIVLGECVGQGGFAKVHKCTVEGGIRGAVCKVISSKKLDDETQYLLKNECKIWSRCSHENIIAFHGMASTATSVMLVCEHMPDGSLFQVHERRRKANAAYLSEPELVKQLLQIASGMQYLHSLEPVVVHRDLKSPNILIAGTRLAIGDFGLARYIDASSVNMTAETGSYRWMAPEVIRHEHYEASCDVYSFAILAWEMMTYVVPFSDMMPVEAAFAVAKHGKRPPIPKHATPAFERLLSVCWAQDAAARPSFSQILEALRAEHDAIGSSSDA